MINPPNSLIRAFFAIALVAFSESAYAQSAADKAADRAFKAAQLRAAPRAAEFPDTQASWINSPPLTVSGLDGKGVILYFFEETCPVCRAAWPALLKTAKTFEGKPVVFIAITSGQPLDVVQKYAKELHIDWPIIVDSTRAFERASHIATISLDNITVVRVITATGSKLLSATIRDLSTDVKIALDGAHWKVDPSVVPAPLHDAWLNVEIGNYSNAAAGIKAATTKGDAATRNAAKLLHDAVNAAIASASDAAEKDEQEGKKWSAYVKYSELTVRFKGFDLSADVVNHQKSLLADPEVKSALQTSKTLQAAEQLMLTSSSLSTRKRATALLRQVQSKAPAGSDLAARADELLRQLESAQD